VKVWIDPEADNSHKAPIAENQYVRAWGRLKAFNQKRHLGAHFIRPIQDMNEVNYHLLEATVVHLHFTKGALGANGEAPQANGANGVSGAKAGNANLPPGLDDKARKVYVTLRDTPSGNEGLHIHDIANRTGFEIADVLKAGDELLGGGLIYQTVDDETWQILNPGETY
jgi:replication factor A2